MVSISGAALAGTSPGPSSKAEGRRGATFPTSWTGSFSNSRSTSQRVRFSLNGMAAWAALDEGRSMSAKRSALTCARPIADAVPPLKAIARRFGRFSAKRASR